MKRDQWLRGFATAVASINTTTAEVRNGLIVAVVLANGLTLKQLEPHAEASDFEEIKNAFESERG